MVLTRGQKILSAIGAIIWRSKKLMNKPEFIYTFKFENDLWRYCYYDVSAAKDKAVEVALSFNPGFEIEGLYFDNDGEDLHLFYDETEDDGEIVTIYSYKMEDFDI